MQKIRLHVQATEEKSKTINVPDDWDEMDETERKDYVEEEAMSYVTQVVKYSGMVVD